MLGKQRVAVTLAMQSCYWVASEEVANVEYIFELTRNEILIKIIMLYLH